MNKVCDKIERHLNERMTKYLKPESLNELWIIAVRSEFRLWPAKGGELTEETITQRYAKERNSKPLCENCARDCQIVFRYATCQRHCIDPKSFHVE